MQTRVKICGITSLEDALYAAEEGASLLGYIFYPPSKRFVAPRNVQAITRAVRSQFPQVLHVGVFVDDEPENVAWNANLAGLDYVQLHGRETPAYCAELDLLGLRVIKAIGIAADGAIIDPADYHVDFFLCDTHDEKLKGGTGRRFDLSRIPAGIAPEKLFLAGGLNADNVAALLDQVQPYAVDVSSGVESSPGRKNHRAIRNFLQAVKSCNKAETQSHQIQKTEEPYVS